jgi:hypothetical protein
MRCCISLFATESYLDVPEHAQPMAAVPAYELGRGEQSAIDNRGYRLISDLLRSSLQRLCHCDWQRLDARSNARVESS